MRLVHFSSAFDFFTVIHHGWGAARTMDMNAQARMMVQHDAKMADKNREVESKKLEVIVLKAELERAYRCAPLGRHFPTVLQYIFCAAAVGASAPAFDQLCDSYRDELSSGLGRKVTGQGESAESAECRECRETHMRVSVFARKLGVWPGFPVA